MPNSVTEALLEMHFHRPLLDFFCEKYGYRKLKAYKPSPQREKWLGFDQVWADTPISTTELAEELKNHIKDGSSSNPTFCIGYFLQFKLVSRFSRRSRHTPELVRAPYYRVEIDTKPDPNTKLSQHDVLKKISTLSGAFTYYACGMIFDSMELYDTDSALDKLCLVDVKQSPDYTMDDERHFIYFQTKDDKAPIWKSNPFEGKAILARDFSPNILHPKQMIAYIEDINKQVEQLLKDRKEKIKSVHYKRYNQRIEEQWNYKSLLQNDLSSLKNKANRISLLIKQLEEKKQQLNREPVDWQAIADVINKERHLKAQYQSTIKKISRTEEDLQQFNEIRVAKPYYNLAATLETEEINLIPPSFRIVILEK